MMNVDLNTGMLNHWKVHSWIPIMISVCFYWKLKWYMNAFVNIICIYMYIYIYTYEHRFHVQWFVYLCRVDANMCFKYNLMKKPYSGTLVFQCIWLSLLQVKCRILACSARECLRCPTGCLKGFVYQPPFCRWQPIHFFIFVSTR